MTAHAATPILDCEGSMGEVFPGVFKTRVPALMYVHRSERVWMLVTTNLKLHPLELFNRESYFSHGMDGGSAEFLWKTTGLFDMAIRQFRLDFLRHLNDEVLSSHIKLAIYLERDVLVEQNAASTLAKSLNSAVAAAGHQSDRADAPQISIGSSYAVVLRAPALDHTPHVEPDAPPSLSPAAVEPVAAAAPEPSTARDEATRHFESGPAADAPPAPEPGPPDEAERASEPDTASAIPADALHAEASDAEAPSGEPAAAADEPSPAPVEEPEEELEPVGLADAIPVAPHGASPSGDAISDLLPGNFYQDYYGFQHMPFNNTPDSFFFFPTEKHQEALSRLIYAISERKGFVVISGEIGAGKTTLCRTLLTQLPRAVKIALITHTHLDSDQLIRAIADEFDLPTDGLSRPEIIARLNTFLIDQLAENCTVCIIIDEAQNLSPVVLEEVRMISNLETEQEKLVQLILLGQPELRDKLKDPTLKQLRQRIAVQYHLAPLDQAETISYITHRLKVAAPVNELHFTRGAMDEVYQYSGGVPRLINTLCDNALLTCFTRGQRKVTHKIVREAARDLALEPQVGGLRQFWKFW